MPQTSTHLRRAIFGAAAVLLASACLTVDNGLQVLTQVSGNNQTIPIGSTTAAPLVVRTLDQGNAPLPGVAIGWQITSGGGTLSASATETDESGFASVTYTPGNTPGAVVVKVTAEGLTLNFNLTVTAATGP